MSRASRKSNRESSIRSNRDKIARTTDKGSYYKGNGSKKERIEELMKGYKS